MLKLVPRMTKAIREPKWRGRKLVKSDSKKLVISGITKAVKLKSNKVTMEFWDKMGILFDFCASLRNIKLSLYYQSWWHTRRIRASRSRKWRRTQLSPSILKKGKITSKAWLEPRGEEDSSISRRSRAKKSRKDIKKKLNWEPSVDSNWRRHKIFSINWLTKWNKITGLSMSPRLKIRCRSTKPIIW